MEQVSANSIYRNSLFSVLHAWVPTVNCPTVKCLTTKCPTAKRPTAKNPITPRNIPGTLSCSGMHPRLHFIGFIIIRQNIILQNLKEVIRTLHYTDVKIASVITKEWERCTFI